MSTRATLHPSVKPTLPGDKGVLRTSSKKAWRGKRFYQDFRDWPTRSEACEAWKRAGVIEELVAPPVTPMKRAALEAWLLALFQPCSDPKMPPKCPYATWELWRPTGWEAWAQASPDHASRLMVFMGETGLREGLGIAWLTTCLKHAGETPASVSDPLGLTRLWKLVAQGWCAAVTEQDTTRAAACLSWLKEWEPCCVRDIGLEEWHGWSTKDILWQGLSLAATQAPEALALWQHWTDAFITHARSHVTSDERHYLLLSFLRGGAPTLPLEIQDNLLAQITAESTPQEKQMQSLSHARRGLHGEPGVGTMKQQTLLGQTLLQTHPCAEEVWRLWWQHAPHLCIHQDWWGRGAATCCHTVEGWIHNDRTLYESTEEERTLEKSGNAFQTFSSLLSSNHFMEDGRVGATRDSFKTDLFHTQQRLTLLTRWLRQETPAIPVAWAATLWWDVQDDLHEALSTDPVTCHAFFETWTVALQSIPWRSILQQRQQGAFPERTEQDEEKKKDPPYDVPFLPGLWGDYQKGTLLRWGQRLAATQAPPELWAKWRTLFLPCLESLEKTLTCMDLQAYRSMFNIKYGERVFVPQDAHSLSEGMVMGSLSELMPFLVQEGGLDDTRLKGKMDIIDCVLRGALPIQGTHHLASTMIALQTTKLSTLNLYWLNPHRDSSGSLALHILFQCADHPLVWEAWLQATPAPFRQHLIAEVFQELETKNRTSTSPHQSDIMTHALLSLTRYCALHEPDALEKVPTFAKALVHLGEPKRPSDKVDLCDEMLESLPASWQKIFHEAFQQAPHLHTTRISTCLARLFRQEERRELAQILTPVTKNAQRQRL